MNFAAVSHFDRNQSGVSRGLGIATAVQNYRCRFSDLALRLYKMYLTYPVAEIDVLRKQDWEIEQGKERTRKLTKPATVVRDDWSPEKNSLAAFFAANEAFAKKVIIVEEDTPRVIDLLEKVGF